MTIRRRISCHGRRYSVELLHRHRAPADAPRLVVVGYQPNIQAQNILQVCLETLRAFTPEPHEIWVVDNASPPEYAGWLRDISEVNVLFNRTPPAPPSPFWQRLRKHPAKPPYAGSYANAIALELAATVVDPHCKYLMTFHMDTVVCRPGWLSYLMSLFQDDVGGVGFRMDNTRVRTLHILGAIFDFQLVRKLGLSFMHQMPTYDVGDGVSQGLAQAGYRLRATNNTFSDPQVAGCIAADSPYRDFPVDRALDDAGNVLFMHLGRGIDKSTAHTPSGKCSPAQWCRFVQEHLLHRPAQETDRT